MSGTSTPDSTARSVDYRDRIRAAREKVNAAAAESERVAASAKYTKRQHADSSRPGSSSRSVIPEDDAASTSDTKASVKSSASSIPSKSPRLLPKSSSDQMASSGYAPQAPSRRDENSWFTFGSASDAQSSQRDSQGFSHRRNEVTSYAETASLYSQPGLEPQPIIQNVFHSTPQHTSQPSDGSSLGEIPDFPVVEQEELQQPAQAAYPTVRIRNIPPPTRRIAESYYSHRSVISPIAEEAPQGLTPDRRRSVATISEQSTPAERNYDDSDDEYRYRSPVSGDVSPIPVRQASVGRAAKAQVTHVRTRGGASRGSKEHSRATSASSSSDLAGVRQSAARASSNLGAGVNHEYSGELQPPLPTVHAQRAVPTSPLAYSQRNSQLAPVVEEIFGSLQKGGAISAGAPPPGASDGPHAHPMTVPPPEDRVSTTSLSDLIRRAKRARTNLEKGKTASRIGLQDFGNREKMGGYEKSTGDKGTWYPREWVDPHGNDGYGDYYTGDRAKLKPIEEEDGMPPKGAKKPRKCCGMPQWLFIVISTVVVICVAAAIIIPVELIVVPRQAAASSNSDLSKCPTTFPCQNSGGSVIYNATCSCACVNGFTGPKCENMNVDISCAKDTSVIPGNNFGNLTMGNSIPIAIANSQRNYSVNLNVSLLAGAFSAGNLRCVDENALVAFGIGDKRRSTRGFFQVPGARNESSPSPISGKAMVTPAPSAVKLQQELRRADITSNNIILADTASPPAMSAAANATGTAAAAAPSSTGTGGAPSQAIIGFAQVAVLFILQQANLQIAQNMHEQLNIALSAPIFRPSFIDIGGGVTVDLTKGTVSVPGLRVGTGNGIM